MKTSCIWLATVLLAASLNMNLNAANEVTVAKEAAQYTVTTTVYTAKVNTNGTLSSLVVGDVEFIAAAAKDANTQQQNAIGLFACPMNQWLNPYGLPSVREQSNNVIRCEGNGWKLEYTFLPDAIDLAWEGTPTGAAIQPSPGRGFKAGYPPAEVALSLAKDLDRACDPENQGEFGWPVKRRPEPGDFAFLAKNGAGLIAEDASWFATLHYPDRVVDLLIFSAYDKSLNYDTSPGPVKRRLKLFRHADLAHSLTMEILAPNRQHIFSHTDEVVIPVKVSALYGQKLTGTVRFQGSPYIWKKPEVTGEQPLQLDDAATSRTVPLTIRPPKPGHYTGVITVTDSANKPLYSQRVGFLFRPEEISAAQPPADFDAFWDQTMAELDKIPLDLTLEERHDLETPAGRVFKAKFRSWGGRWAWAWLNVPKASGKVPGKIMLPAVSVYQPPPPDPADGHLRIAVAIHGGDLKDYPAKPDFDYMNTGITNRETYMLHYSYCCVARCFDILKNHEKCNGEINAEGGSQGAGLTLVLCGLRRPASSRGINVALCRIDWTVLGYTQWGPGCPPGQDPKKIAEVVRYFDPANFAHRIHTPLRLAFGLFDFCAPAEGIFSALNALPRDTPCQIFVDPYGGHFTMDATDFNQGAGLLEVPRWQGSVADNKLVR